MVCSTVERGSLRAFVTAAATLVLSLSSSDAGGSACSSQISGILAERTIRFGNQVELNCPILDSDASTFWWRSTDCTDLATFRPHASCSTPRCRVTQADYSNGHLYYCCSQSAVLTPSDLLQCHQISFCTNITHVARPPLLLAGSTERIHVSVTAGPQTPALVDDSSELLTVIMPNGAGRTLEYVTHIVSTTLSYVLVYEFQVPLDASGGLAEVSINFDVASGCPTADLYEEINIAQGVLVSSPATTSQPPNPTTTEEEEVVESTDDKCTCKLIRPPFIGVTIALVVIVLALSALVVLVVLLCVRRRQAKRSGKASGFPSPLYDVVADDTCHSKPSKQPQNETKQSGDVARNERLGTETTPSGNGTLVHSHVTAYGGLVTSSPANTVYSFKNGQPTNGVAVRFLCPQSNSTECYV